MSDISVEDFQFICRLCLNKGKLLPIFSDDTADKIIYCIAMEVTLNDKLPQNICEKCISLVKEWSNFKQMCLQSFELLNQALEKDNSSPNDGNDGDDIGLEDKEFSPPIKTSDVITLIKKTNENLIKPLQHPCEYCELIFKRPSSLLKHLKHTHNIEGLVFPCGICEKTFPLKTLFSNHLLSHRKPWKCQLCDKSFSTRGILRSHKYKHFGKFKCNKCGFCCTSNANLQTHMTSHSQDRPISCSICQKKFTLKRVLKTHMKVHTKEKNYICDICGYATAQSGNLKNHLFRHNSKTRFICDVCGERFGRKAVLRQHVHIHKMGEPSYFRQ